MLVGQAVGEERQQGALPVEIKQSLNAETTEQCRALGRAMAERLK